MTKAMTESLNSDDLGRRPTPEGNVSNPPSPVFFQPPPSPYPLPPRDAGGEGYIFGISTSNVEEPIFFPAD
jgi:hypothetical protein